MFTTRHLHFLQGPSDENNEPPAFISYCKCYFNTINLIVKSTGVLVLLADRVEISHSWFSLRENIRPKKLILIGWLVPGPGQVRSLYCNVMRSTAVLCWLYWVIRGRSLDNKDSGPRGERRFSLAGKSENLISTDNLDLAPLYSLQSLTTYNSSPLNKLKVSASFDLTDNFLCCHQDEECSFPFVEGRRGMMQGNDFV